MKQELTTARLQSVTDAVAMEKLSDSIRRGEYPGAKLFPAALERVYRLQARHDAVAGMRILTWLLVMLVGLTTFFDAFIGGVSSVPIWDLKIPTLVVLMMVGSLSHHKHYLRYAVLAQVLVFCTIAVFGFGSAAYSVMPFSAFYIALTAGMLSACLMCANTALVKVCLTWSLTMLAATYYWQLQPQVLAETVLIWNSILSGFAVLSLGLLHYLDTCRRRYFLVSHFSTPMITAPREWQSNQDRVRFLTAIDKVMGIADRNSFDRALKFEWHRARKNTQSLSLLLIDSSELMASDTKLYELAQDLKQFAKRPGDILAKFEGNKMALLLVDTGLANARLMAHKIFSHLDDDLSERLTIGLASITPRPGLFSGDLLATADKACLSASRNQRIRALMSSNL